MDSESRPNPLSKVETIEQLRTTIEKLETIIDQLNSTSIVYLPSSNSVETLITTTEELENAIANMPPEEVVAESQITPTSNEVVVESSEVTSISPQQKPSEREAETAETLESQPTNVQTPETIEPIAPKNITKPINQAQPKITKPKKKKNWIAIAIVTLLVALIPLGIKYFPLGSTQQILAKNTKEIIVAEPSDITTDLSENKSPENIISPTPSVAVKQKITTSSSEIEKQPIEQETTEIAISPSARHYAIADSPTEQVVDSNLEKPLSEEKTESILTAKSDSETTVTNSQLEEKIVTSDLDELEANSSTISPREEDIAKQLTEEQLIDETVALGTDEIAKNTLEPEANISVPENIAAEVAADTLDLKTVIQEVKLAPEQKLIAVLQEKILQLSEDYQSDLVTSIEPNIANNILIVKISNDWYQLDSTEQDKIIADMYKRSQKLKFRKLEIEDQESNLVARSPVVGQNMIVYLRKKDNL